MKAALRRHGDRAGIGSPSLETWGAIMIMGRLRPMALSGLHPCNRCSAWSLAAVWLQPFNHGRICRGSRESNCVAKIELALIFRRVKLNKTR
jgi:hypothetical protein